MREQTQQVAKEPVSEHWSDLNVEELPVTVPYSHIVHRSYRLRLLADRIRFATASLAIFPLIALFLHQKLEDMRLGLVEMELSTGGWILVLLASIWIGLMGRMLQSILLERASQKLQERFNVRGLDHQAGKYLVIRKTQSEYRLGLSEPIELEPTSEID
jgi:hypothetical protein